MSVRPTLVSLGFGFLLTSLIAFAALYSGCQADQAAAASRQLTAAAGKSAATPPPAGGNQASVTPAAAVQAAAEKKPYIWQVIRADDKIKLRGMVPSEDDRRTILGMVKAHFPDLEIEDELKIAPGAPSKEQWLGAVSFALKQLSHLNRGNAKLSDVALSLTGTAKTNDDYSELRQALYGPLPTGLSLQNDSIQPPKADPYIFSAALHDGMLVLSGYVPNEELHKRLKDMAQKIFVNAVLSDKLTLASGAPTKWNNAAAAALSALSKLDDGKVTLTGAALTIKGIAPDKGTASGVAYQLKHDLPSVFTSSENIKWKEAGAARDVAKKIIPRIKEIVDTGSIARENVLPSLSADGAP